MCLIAAPVLGIDPQRRAVVEDTVAGVVPEIVFSYSTILSTHVDTTALRQVDAHHIFIDMDDLAEVVS